MEEYGGHPLFPKIKLLLKEGKKPFDQSVISISDAWKCLEELDTETGEKCPECGQGTPKA